MREVFAKTGTEKISARFSNIKLIVNDQVVKTKPEPFIYNGNIYAPVATVANALGIKQVAACTIALLRKKSCPKVILTGTSDQEFLVMYRYHTIEELPSEAYLTLFRQSNGKVVPVNTSKVFDVSK